MAKVHVLSDQVANQIAAGEVIERPASIVKELVENSLDAGATSLEIEFKRGGTSFIRIEDNGSGMSKDDALLSLERHATSKIQKADDLDLLTSMGFRGEALPSIASVSRFQIQTKEAETDAGTEILVNGGKMVHVKECGMPQGTRITVSQLFNTVPARRKFLKSQATESAHIVHHSRLYALAHPNVAFKLIDDGRILFQSPACDRLRDRIGEIFGKRIASNLLEVDVQEGDLRLRGLIGAPGQSRSSRHEMLMFVNNRPVENRTLGYALIESYYGHIPKGRYPVAFLFLDIPPAKVDVNVHPAKREIRFRNEATVRGFAVRAILDTLRKAVGESTVAPVPVALPEEDGSVEVTATPIAKSKPAQKRRPLIVSKKPIQEPKEKEPAEEEEYVEAEAEIEAVSPSDEYEEEVPEESAPEENELLNSSWNFLGFAQNEFALYETGSGIVLLDWKAAQRRVWTERLERQYADASVEQQSLLLPIPIELDPVSSVILSDHIEFLENHGVSVAPFGRNFFRIEGVPGWLPEKEAESYVEELVTLLRRGTLSDKKVSAANELLAARSASRIVRGTTAPTEAEIASLLDDLFNTRNPLTDPEGHPSFIEIKRSEIDRRFHKSGSSKAETNLF